MVYIFILQKIRPARDRLQHFVHLLLFWQNFLYKCYQKILRQIWVITNSKSAENITSWVYWMRRRGPLSKTCWTLFNRSKPIIQWIDAICFLKFNMTICEALLLPLGQSTKHDGVDLGHLPGKWWVIRLKRGHFVWLSCKSWGSELEGPPWQLSAKGRSK